MSTIKLDQNALRNVASKPQDSPASIVKAYLYEKLSQVLDSGHNQHIETNLEGIQTIVCECGDRYGLWESYDKHIWSLMIPEELF